MKGKTKADRNSRIFGITVIVAFIVSLIVMQRYELPFRALSNQAATLDMRFHYNSFEVYKLFDTLGIQGSHLYIKILLIDFIFIVSFALMQNLILKRIMGKALLKTRLRYLLAVSYLRGLADIIENISILVLIIKYPLEMTGLVTFSSFFTTLKFVFLGLWLIAAVIIPLIRISRKEKINE